MIRTLLTLTLLTAIPMFAADATPQAVTGTDGREMLIPVAGRVAGAGGELFQTDLTLVNLTGLQHVRLTWLPAGGTATPLTRTIAMEAFTHRTISDVVATEFGTSGLGAILIEGVDAQGNAMPAAALDANARIWTETTCANLRGTVSQSVPAVLLEGWRNDSPAYIHGVRHNTQFRTNYGIVNFGPHEQAFRVLVNSQGGREEEEVTVPAFGTVHRPVPPGVSDALSIFIEPLSGLGMPMGQWRAYASTTDNVSGSGWTVVAIQPRTDIQF